jgi:hypothetical protein
MPYPSGHSRINLGLAIAQVILRSTYQPLHSVPHWSLTSSSDFTSVITSLCRVGRVVVVKAVRIGQAERIHEKSQMMAFSQMERIAVTAELLSTHTRPDLPPLPREFFHVIVELCIGRLLERFKGEGSNSSETEQLLRAIDESLIKTIGAIRIHTSGRAGGMFWNLLADRWAHEIKVKFGGEEAVDGMPIVGIGDTASTFRLIFCYSAGVTSPMADSRVCIGHAAGRQSRPYCSSAWRI